MRFIKILSCTNLLLLCICCEAVCQYAFYNGDSVNVRYADTKNNFSQLNSSVITIPVIFPNHPGWNFVVPLQQELHNEPPEFAAASKLFVLSDIEGEFEAFRQLLLVGKVIDEKYNWIYGKGHLVICGDLFDRGEMVTEYLWLLYKLEQDAKAKGGYVHVILGNHDIMNLGGDYRYVQPKYFEEAKQTGVAYKDLFAPNTALGRWLRTKNIAERIGNQLYLHAGVSAQVNALQFGLEKINSICRPFYDKPLKELPDSLKAFFHENGPFWYRGYFVEPAATLQQVDSTLRLFSVNTIIVGHTVLDAITSFYQGKVVGIDVNQHEGEHRALVITGNKYYVLNDKGKQKRL